MNNKQLSIFEVIEGQKLNYLMKYPVQAQCHLQSSFYNQNFQKEKILLQVRGKWVVKYSVEQKRVTGGFECNYDIKFYILRSCTENSKRIGAAIGIKFTQKWPIQKEVTFNADQQFSDQIQDFKLILQNKFIVQTGFHQLFKGIRRIGQGSTACVYNVYSLVDEKQVAVKGFKRSVYFQKPYGKNSFLQQFKILLECRHENICRLLGVYETQNSTYIVLQYFPNSLFCFLRRLSYPNEYLLKKILSDLLKGVKYLHQNGVMHRDLKLQNIMIKNLPNNNYKAVIIDLGLAQYISSKRYSFIRCGTPGYVAPQILAKKTGQIQNPEQIQQTYNGSCDIFSIGVIFHILLLKKVVFEGRNPQEVIAKNTANQINFQDPIYNVLSNEAKQLLCKMLEKDPKNRISAENALKHPFLKNQNFQIQTQENQ